MEVFSLQKTFITLPRAYIDSEFSLLKSRIVQGQALISRMGIDYETDFSVITFLPMTGLKIVSTIRVLQETVEIYKKHQEKRKLVSRVDPRYNFYGANVCYSTHGKFYRDT